MAALIPPTSGPKIIEKSDGIIIAGLNCPVPHGLTIYDVTKDPRAYSIAPIAVAEIFRDTTLYMLTTV